MQGEAEAIMRIAPDPVGSGTITAAQSTVLAAGSTGDVMIPKSLDEGCWVTFKPDINCRIRFGCAPAAGNPRSIAAAVATDILFFGGMGEDYWVPVGIDRMRIFAAGAGELSWHRSNR